MKRSAVLLRPTSRAGAVLLTMAIVLLIGCTGGDDTDNSNADVPSAGINGLSSRELVALKKANPGAGNFQKALQKKELEDLQAQGVVVRTSPSWY
jgi:hypothetical protein